ncbi:IS110 family transposase [Mycobacterium simiae]|uniref:IS110 family transposase n=1 Tax=Mycobacterium simiae TaxID=1784 RepID=A0A5B1BLX7_MYCSI|nr:IS110 family transposase [Mycobacterium simiae]KAA1248855.1 IS110 family transposase [Mycobacterium simiae]
MTCVRSDRRHSSIDDLLDAVEPDDKSGGASPLDDGLRPPTGPNMVERLSKIPGIGQTGAPIILAEIGPGHDALGIFRSVIVQP